ncbi:hypothetical protein [Desulfoscipio geothermicus]|uniref:Uncharacterized protein n=1 Tax=Desulfoscipio geothermicus DSM 3669 TaxID=1121426 RepID=A0A1I6D4D6_9FIRM|nr:hypothetical protein [Desulfoscipio geothermicus]SFR00233.1 hypothetical protein SAMN05660706_10549 [Desulfoscipio geothermicus DSM 3669]
MVILVILAFLGIIGIEVPGLVKKKMWRELIAFSVLLLVGMALSIPQALGIQVPSPNKPIELLFKPLVEWMRL